MLARAWVRLKYRICQEGGLVAVTNECGAEMGFAYSPNRLLFKSIDSQV